MLAMKRQQRGGAAMTMLNLWGLRSASHRWAVATIALGCLWPSASATARQTPQTQPSPPTSPSDAGLPVEVQAAVWETYGPVGAELRYVDGSVDLNGDGKPEVVVFVVGMACGTGGCPTLVFTPEEARYRLISTIVLTQTPVRASPRATNGWRNLIVHIAGGGGRSADVELTFNGETYPKNPTVTGTRLAAPAAADATIVIADFKSFDSTKVLLRPGSTSSAAPPSAPASSPAPSPPAPSSPEASTQSAQSSASAQSHAPAPTALPAVAYKCQGHESTPLTVVFDNQSRPPSAAIAFGDRKAILTSALSGSGARYTAPEIELWEHHGEATLTWSGAKYTCGVVR
jgi:membrane-bound inhibitor of C-type lysozyme